MGNLKSVWASAVMLMTLVLTGVIFINYHPYAYVTLSSEHKSLLVMADAVMIIGSIITVVEVKNRYDIRKQKKELENVKKIRHEYRRHIQNVQALLYIEAYDEVDEYARAIEEELRVL